MGAAAALAALGVVYGDIGTSPIYTIQTIFNPEDPHPVPLTVANVYGLVSLVFWSVTVIVTLLYVGLVLRADNNGEGGILSLITLVARPARRRRARVAAGGVDTASDHVSEGSATRPGTGWAHAHRCGADGPGDLRGLAVPGRQHDHPGDLGAVGGGGSAGGRAGAGVAGHPDHGGDPGAAVRGAADRHRAGGPAVRAGDDRVVPRHRRRGGVGIAQEPGILRALSPTYAAAFLVGRFEIAFFALAAVVLAVTGAEALYADLGHFGRTPIARAWLLLVFPACVLSYFGQGALILADGGDPEGAVRAPFFLLVPSWALIPLVVLATAATVIASQAVITGAFSVARQAVQLGYLPRLRIVHTSAQTIGQIYVPYVNWALLVMVIVLVFSFRTSAALAYAFGMAVTGTIVITTLLIFYVAWRGWGWPLWVVVPVGGAIMGFEALFLAANLTKIASGAWLPLVIAVIVFTVMTTWNRGRQLVTRAREEQEGPLDAFVEDLRSREVPAEKAVIRIPGTGVFMNRGKKTVPLAMRANVEHLRVLHRQVVIVSVETQPVPAVADADIAVIDDLGYRDDGITHITARFGYMQRTNIPAVLAALPPAALESGLDLPDASYFLSSIELRASSGESGDRSLFAGMPRWRRVLFVATSRLTADAADSFELPRERTVITGSRIVV